MMFEREQQKINESFLRSVEAQHKVNDYLITGFKFLIFGLVCLGILSFWLQYRVGQLEHRIEALETPDE